MGAVWYSKELSREEFDLIIYGEGIPMSTHDEMVVHLRNWENW